MGESVQNASGGQTDRQMDREAKEKRASGPRPPEQNRAASVGQSFLAPRAVWLDPSSGGSLGWPTVPATHMPVVSLHLVAEPGPHHPFSHVSASKPVSVPQTCSSHRPAACIVPSAGDAVTLLTLQGRSPTTLLVTIDLFLFCDASSRSQLTSREHRASQDPPKTTHTRAVTQRPSEGRDRGGERGRELVQRAQQLAGGEKHQPRAELSPTGSPRGLSYLMLPASLLAADWLVSCFSGQAPHPTVFLYY